MTTALSLLSLLSLLLSAALSAVQPAQDATAVPGAGALSVREVDVFLMPQDGRLRVGFSYLIENTGAEAYAGETVAGVDRPVSVIYPIPEAAEDLRFDAPEGRFAFVAGGLADTAPVEPGERGLTARFSYALPTVEGAALNLSMAMPVQWVVVLVASEQYEVASGWLSEGGWMDTEMGRTRVYSGGPLAAGEALAFSVRRAAATAAPAAPTAASAVAPSSAEPNPAAELAVGVVALAAAVPAAYLLWRPRRLKAAPEAAAPLIDALAALQDDLEAGNVSAADYRKRQAALRRQLAAVLGKQGGQRP